MDHITIGSLGPLIASLGLTSIGCKNHSKLLLCSRLIAGLGKLEITIKLDTTRRWS